MTPHDYDRLSAYHDQQLSPSERAKLEVRLEREPELQAALADLRATVRALRSLPTHKPPRNFTLSRAQAQAHARPRFQFWPSLPTLRLATTLAGFAFIMVLASDLLALQSGGQLAAPASVVQETTQKSEPVAEAVTEAPPADTSADIAASSGPAPETTPPAPEIAISAVTPVIETFAVTTSTETARSAPPPPTDTPPPQGYDTAAQAGAATDAVSNTATTSSDETSTAWPPIRYLEISLGLLTTIFAGWLWLQTRRGF